MNERQLIRAAERVMRALERCISAPAGSARQAKAYAERDKALLAWNLLALKVHIAASLKRSTRHG